MKNLLRKLSVSLSRSSGWWLTLLLLLVVIVPSVCLLWFMNQAVRNERLAVRQKLADAYRGHLSLAQERLAAHWTQIAGELEAQVESSSAPLLFERLVREGKADAVVCFDSAGNVSYPDTVHAVVAKKSIAGLADIQRLESSDPAAAAKAYAEFAEIATNVNHAAIALLAQARCLIRTGSKAEAFAVLTGPLSEEKYRGATDVQGRLLAPNAALMALELFADSAPDQVRIPRERLEKRLVDYSDAAMSASQRRFLMNELQKLFPNDARFPTLAAEDLAARYLEAGVVNAREPELRATLLPGVWQFASARGRAVLLYKTENLSARMLAIVSSHDLPSDVRMDVVPPGQEAEGSLLSLAAGPSLPGWRLAVSLQDQRLFDSTTQERITSYVWIGFLVVATVIVLALLALGMIRRQVALTQLRNDLVANVTHELKTPLSSMRLFVETLLNSETLDEKTTREYLQLIAKENVRLSRLIDNFLTFSRIERNKYAFDFKEVPAAKIAEGAVEAARERLSAPGCRFDVNIAPNLPPVTADADAMVTVLLNLLDNACKYSGDSKQISFTAGAKNGDVFFAVRDNGIGLSQGDAKRVFKRFYQVHQHMSPTSGGCGLGLSIVQFVVTAHHGTVRVESEPGRGSTFIVTIPTVGPSKSPKTTS